MTIEADSVHPVETAVRADILDRLERIERSHGVSILYACETGSRGWGFASPDSDYDVRFLYVHPLDWYLQVTPGRDVIEVPLDGLLDINGWELRKALQLLKKGNATLVEWLSSPIVYGQAPAFAARLRRLASQVHRPDRSFYHYLHMARGNLRGYLRSEQVRLKKYLYVLRPVLACIWIERGYGVVPMRFETLVEAIVDVPELRSAIDRLLAVKRRAGEAGRSAAIPEINAFLERELERLGAWVPAQSEEVDFAPLDRLLQDSVQGVLAGLRASPVAANGREDRDK